MGSASLTVFVSVGLGHRESRADPSLPMVAGGVTLTTLPSITQKRYNPYYDTPYYMTVYCVCIVNSLHTTMCSSRTFI